jgi:CRISPR-associated protein Cas1
MANLYVTEQGAVLRKTGERIIVEKDGSVLLDVQCNQIDGVLLFGNVQFTTQVAHKLFEHGIEMALLTKTGKLLGQITSPFPKNIELRYAQFKKYDDPSFRLALSKILVNGKISNCLNLCKTFSYNHPEVDLKATSAGLESSLRQIELCQDLSALFGVEGHSATIYFQGYGKMILSSFTFTGRKKRPPTDPVNALLSLGYTLIYNEIASLLDGLGFDPYLGYFHHIDYGRASLACDIQEEFRAFVDRFTLYLVNNKMLQEKDFFTNPKGGGVYLKQDAMKRYFVEYERYANQIFIHPETKETTTLRKSFRIQAEKMAKTIQDGPCYTPMKMAS